VTQKELNELMAERFNRSPAEVRRFLGELAEIVQETIASGEVVQLRGIATVKPVHRAARMARNPQTGEPVQVESRWSVRLKPLQALRDAAQRRSG
jgi:nucleoid DNA-binding protein